MFQKVYILDFFVHKLMPSKYFVVVHGLERGIFDNFSAASIMINNYPGAIFRSFFTLTEAENYLRFVSSPVSHNHTSSLSTSPPKLSRFSILSVFISCSSSSFGLIIHKPNHDETHVHGKIASTAFSPIIYSFYVALSLVSGNLTIVVDTDKNKSLIYSFMENKNPPSSAYAILQPFIHNRKITIIVSPPSDKLLDLVLTGESCTTNDIVISYPCSPQ